MRMGCREEEGPGSLNLSASDVGKHTLDSSEIPPWVLLAPYHRKNFIQRKPDDRISTTLTQLDLEDLLFAFQPTVLWFLAPSFDRAALTEVHPSPSLHIFSFQNTPLSCFSSRLSDRPSLGPWVGSTSPFLPFHGRVSHSSVWTLVPTLRALLCRTLLACNSCRLYWVEGCRPWSHSFLQPQDAALFGKRVVAALMS